MGEPVAMVTEGLAEEGQARASQAEEVERVAVAVETMAVAVTELVAEVVATVATEDSEAAEEAAAETVAMVAAAKGRVKAADQATVDAVAWAVCEERVKAEAAVAVEEVEVDTPHRRCIHCRQDYNRANAVGAEAMEVIRAAAVAWAVMVAEGRVVEVAVRAVWVEMMVVVAAETEAAADVEVVVAEAEAVVKDLDMSRACHPGHSHHIPGSTGIPHTSRRSYGRVG